MNPSEILELTNFPGSLCCLPGSHTSEIAFGDFSNFLPSIPQVQNIQEGSQHQVLNRDPECIKSWLGQVYVVGICPRFTHKCSFNLQKIGENQSPHLYMFFRRP